jgi:hypothetical protein
MNPGRWKPPSENAMLKQESQRAVVQTSPTSFADQPHVAGAIAVRVIGILLILQSGWRLYNAVRFALLAFERALNESSAVFAFAVVMPSAIGLLTLGAGVLLVRRDLSARVFGLVACSIALAYQVLTLGSTLITFRMVAPGRTLGMVYWAIQAADIALFLIGIIVIARWRPYQLPDRYPPPPR